jgi:hypothetical protein
VCAVLSLAACGSGEAAPDSSEPSKSTTGSTGPKAETTTSPAASYFAQADSDAINKAAAPAQAAGTKAASAPAIAKCGRIREYPAWRACWHALLDPFATRLTQLAGTLRSRTAGDRPSGCVAKVNGASEVFTGFEGRVEGLLAGFDSDDRAAQTKAVRQYRKTVQKILTGFAKPFQDVTQACYSPEDLASINASPSPGPSPSPSPSP